MKDNTCQCCLLYCDDKIDSEYKYFGKEVIYFEIIKETFNITITSEINKICSKCVKKLKDASEFRRLIQKTQNELQKIQDTLKTQDPCYDNNIDECVKINKNLWEIDKSSEDNVKGMLNPIQPITSFEKKNKKSGVKHDVEDNSTTILKETVQDNDDNIAVISNENANRTKVHRATREDSLKLLKYSNICLFKSLKTKYQCFSCNETFLNISDLRLHSKMHSISKEKGFKINLKGHSSKNADISSLSCTLCYQTCKDLNILKNHLTNKHSIEFTSADHMFVPFKLENGFKCVTCGEEFNSFVRLSTHMNAHSTNNVCEKCGMFFINRLGLRTHLQSVHREKTCTMCTAKFEKNYTKVKHMRLVHNIGAIRRYCTVCGKDFRHSYKLLEHKIKEHGAQRLISNCTECGKTFLSPQNLKIHIRSVHVKERNFQCNICGMSFFTKADEKRHGRRHDDVKLFSCNYCEGKFKSKDSWRRHLKRIHEKLVV